MKTRYTYVVLGIHGQYDLFKRLLEVIDFDDSDVMYILGDIIDKGSLEGNRNMELTVKEKAIVDFFDNYKVELANNDLMAILSDKYLEEKLRSISCSIQEFYVTIRKIIPDYMDYMTIIPKRFFEDDIIEKELFLTMLQI